MRRLAILVAVLAVVLSACAGADDPVVDSPPDDPTDEVPDEPDDDADGTDAQDDAPPADEAPADETPADEADTDDEEAEDGNDGDEAAATPDAAALDDPCADHREREGEAFIELVAPVDDQQVDGQLELVGCSSVYEGTVQYRVLDGDGVTLEEGFTTAECGGPCIGEFRESVPLDAADGEPVAYIQVFWEDASDGSERDLVERIVVLE